MIEWNNFKILICDMNNEQGSSVELLLSQYQFRHVIFEHDITELKRRIYHNNPDVIISGNHLWNDETGVRFIIQYPYTEKAHVIIWSDNLQNDLQNLILKKKNLHFIKKTNGEMELINTLKNLNFG